MMLDQHFFNSLEEEKNLLDHLLTDLQIQTSQDPSLKPKSMRKELNLAYPNQWLIRMGLCPEANFSASHIGLYTDFT